MHKCKDFTRIRELNLGIGLRHLLLIAGGKDRTVARSVVETNHRKQQQSKAITDYKLFLDRTHWLIADSRGKDVAGHAIQWASNHAYGQVTKTSPQMGFEPMRAG